MTLHTSTLPTPFDAPAAPRHHSLAELAALTRRYARRRRKVLLQAQFDAEHRWYTRLGADDRHEAWLIAWLPGQSTDWHDHGDSAGAFTVLTGVLTEDHADESISASISPEWPLHRSQMSTRIWSDGSLRQFGTRHVHRVSNFGHEPAVSLHVYGPALSQMTAYDWMGDLLHGVGVRRIGSDW